MHLVLQLQPLLPMVKELDGLLKGHGNEQANDDGGDVYEKVRPGVNGGAPVPLLSGAAPQRLLRSPRLSASSGPHTTSVCRQLIKCHARCLLLS
jgi:hypothetical protein